MPDSPEAWRGLGLALREADELDAALGALRRARALRPDAEAEMSLGNALLARGERAASLAHLLLRRVPRSRQPRMLVQSRLARHARGETEAPCSATGGPSASGSASPAPGSPRR